MGISTDMEVFRRTPQTGSAPVVIGDEDVVTGDLTETYLEDVFGESFVIVTMSPYIGQGGQYVGNPPRA
jgi:hypothetical protein